MKRNGLAALFALALCLGASVAVGGYSSGTAGSGIAKQYFTLSTGATTLATGATNYLSPSGISTPNATENSVRSPLPPGTLSDFWCRTLTAPDNGGGTQSYTFTVREDGADTALQVVISEATINGTLDTDTVVLSTTPANHVSISSVPAGTPIAQTALCYFSFVPSP